MGRCRFSHPIASEQVPDLMKALADGRSADVGQVSFSKDEHGLWGTDPYGADFFLGEELDESRILACVATYHDPEFIHPAEYSH